MNETLILASYVLFPTIVFLVFAYFKCKEEENQETEQVRHRRPTAGPNTVYEPPLEGIPQVILDSYQRRHAVGHILESTDAVINMEGQEAISIFSADFGENHVLPVEEASCSICLIDYQHGDSIQRNAFVDKSITCNHIFHPECIAAWIERSRESKCPCCRNPFG